MTTTLVEHGDALREVVADLSKLTIQQLVELFRRYGDRDRKEMRALVHAVLPDLVGPHSQAAAVITAQWYDELNPASDYQAAPVVDLDPGRIEKTTAWAFYAPGRADPLPRLSGSVQRMVFDASRDTAVANAEAEGVVGWARHAQPDACAFCRLLATRTAGTDGLYRSKGSATRVRRTRGSRNRGEKYHDHCRCVAVPVRAYGYDPPDYVVEWETQYIDARRAVGGDPKDILAHMRSADGGDGRGRKGDLPVARG